MMMLRVMMTMMVMTIMCCVVCRSCSTSRARCVQPARSRPSELLWYGGEGRGRGGAGEGGER